MELLAAPPVLAGPAEQRLPTHAHCEPCINSSNPAYGLFSASGNIRFDQYTVSIGIENLLDEEPPCLGANPANAGFALECTRTSAGSVYDPLGRQYYISMSMDF